MVAEKDIPKVREALSGTAYKFSDNRLSNKKILEDGAGHTLGEHEVIANHKDNEFHLGFFLFRREQDNSLTIREYFMQENENGEKVPMVLERNCPKELVELEYSEERTEYAGTSFKTSTPESVYAKKMHTGQPKDKLDIEALKDKVDKEKIAEMEKYKTTLRIVEPNKMQRNEESILQSEIQITDGKPSKSIKNEQIMKIDEVRNLSKSLYDEVVKNGISAIKKIFSKGKTLFEELRYDRNTEYIKEMIISQWDEDTIQALFGNSLDIGTDEEYEEWKKFIYSDRRGDKDFDTIFGEEEFKFGYENETNLLKKFVKSFKYKKMQKGNYLEDSYVKKVREMMRKTIEENPDNTFIALFDTRSAVKKGIAEYESLKEIEGIVRMTLVSLDVKTEGIIDIEAECKRLREEIKSDTGITRIGTEYLQDLQEKYEEAYNTQDNPEEYIRKVANIYADFIYLRPYEDGNQRIAICLFNSMLCSKGIVPPPISLTNDDEMIKAFSKVQEEKDYSMIQDVMVSRYKKMQVASGSNNKRSPQKNVEQNIKDGI